MNMLLTVFLITIVLVGFAFAGLGLNILLKGEDIHTKLEHFSGESSDHRVEGKIRGGGIDVELITSEGNINLNYD